MEGKQGVDQFQIFLEVVASMDDSTSEIKVPRGDLSSYFVCKSTCYEQYDHTTRLKIENLGMAHLSNWPVFQHHHAASSHHSSSIYQQYNLALP